MFEPEVSTADRPPTKATAAAPDAPLWTPLALLLEEDDAFFSEQLPALVKANEFSPSDAQLWHPQVLTRLCALGDPLVTATVLALAQEDCLGLDILFDERLLPRLAQVRHGHLRGTFLPYARRIPGFDARDFLRELRPYQLRYQRQHAETRALLPLTGSALFAKDIPELECIVEDILPVGATLFVGRAKDGKSLAMWNLCLAVASGGMVFGRYKAQQGAVLYLALEDGERRAKKRLLEQMQAMNMDTPPEGFEVVCWEAPRVGEGLEEQLHGWLDTHPGAKLIVIDILEKVRPPRTRNGSVYADDYAAVAPLQRLAQDRGIALVIVHHTHKAKVDDFRDAPSGSISLLGAVDTLWSLRRVAGERDAVLQITGRDLVETPALAMQFQGGFWTARGDAATTVLNPAHQAILATLRTTGSPMTPTQLATVLHVNLNTMKVHLMRLAERGLVAKTGQGQYTHAIVTPMAVEGVTPCNPVTPSTWAQEEAMPVPSPADHSPGAASREQIPPQETSTSDDVSPEVGREGDTVTRVTPVTHQSSPANGASNGQTNGHHTGLAPSMVLPCANCNGTARWNDRGILRCSACWPKAMC
jgi:hypothetical protein